MMNPSPTVKLVPLASQRFASDLVSLTTREDRRAAVRHLSPEKINRCAEDARRSLFLPMQGSAVAALIEYSETCYPDGPNGRQCGDN